MNTETALVRRLHYRGPSVRGASNGKGKRIKVPLAPVAKVLALASRGSHT